MIYCIKCVYHKSVLLLLLRLRIKCIPINKCTFQIILKIYSYFTFNYFIYILIIQLCSIIKTEASI